MQIMDLLETKPNAAQQQEWHAQMNDAGRITLQGPLGKGERTHYRPDQQEAFFQKIATEGLTIDGWEVDGHWNLHP